MALYHTYRPQTFADVVDQAHIIQTLENQVKHGKTSHAYLFNGPRGIGKTTTARILAKALNCQNRKEDTSEPCNECQFCQEITSSNSIDVIEIDAASHTGVDNVRQNIIENAQFKPTQAKYKIFIIDEVHMLSTAAFNALLKTLEEPPEHVVFILATTDPQKLPATIISRCQRFNFSKVSDDEMKKYIKHIAKVENVKISDDIVKRVVKKGEGCVRDAMSLLDQLLATGEKEIDEDIAAIVMPTTNIELQLEFTKYLAHKDEKQGLEFIDTLITNGVSIPHFGNDLLEFLRLIMIASVDKNLAEKELDLSKDGKKDLQELTDILDQSEIIKLLDLAIKRNTEIKSSVLPQLPLEMLVIEWCHTTNNKQHTISTPTSSTIEKPHPTQKIETTHTTEPPIQKIKLEEKTTESVVLETKTEEVEDTVTEDTIETTSQSVTKADVENKWGEFMKKIEVIAPSLTFILKMTNLDEVKGNILHMSVPYSFHQQKLLENQTRAKLETSLKEIFGGKLKIDVRVSEEGRQQDASGSELQELASALGGEVI